MGGILKRLVAWIAIFSTWEGAYRVLEWDAWQFPAPSHVLDATLQMVGVQTSFGDPLSAARWPLPARPAPASGADKSIFELPLVRATLVSVVRLAVGFVLSLSLGALLGVFMWRFREADEFLGPLFLGLQTLPSVCWVPLAIIAFGLNERAILFVVVMGSAFAIALALRDGLRVVPPVYQRAGLMLGASSWRLYRYVLLPASLPALASSLRQGFSFAWRALMGAEFVLVAVRWHGLGFLLETGRNFADVAQVVAVMGVMVLAGMLVDRCGLAILERRIYQRFGLVAAD
jgi:NitT/TauT family transport system permease protein